MTSSLKFFGVFMFLIGSVQAQDIIPIIDIQGEQDISPYVDQVVTFNAKVTESFGDFWYMQDEYGAWNGILVVEPTLLVPANSPWWDEPRQPEVGDELTLTGTVVEVDGNTQLIDVTLVEQTEFWLATPAGTVANTTSSQDEALEGTGVRLMGVTVVTGPDENEEWIISDDNGEMTCVGLDDEVYPFPGDIYNVFGALFEVNGEYKVQIGEVEVISLDIKELSEPNVSIYPNPVNNNTKVISEKLILNYTITDMSGRTVKTEKVHDFMIDLNNVLNSGYYILQLEFEDGIYNYTFVRE